uniref:Uncharacterized protein n=1 Tax=Oryza meridionalis TaxID=40149 RepID=A0A0E0C8Y8_9ORYZ
MVERLQFHGSGRAGVVGESTHLAGERSGEGGEVDRRPCVMGDDDAARTRTTSEGGPGRKARLSTVMDLGLCGLLASAHSAGSNYKETNPTEEEAIEQIIRPNGGTAAAATWRRACLLVDLFPTSLLFSICIETSSTF